MKIFGFKALKLRVARKCACRRERESRGYLGVYIGRRLRQERVGALSLRRDVDVPVDVLAVPFRTKEPYDAEKAYWADFRRRNEVIENMRKELESGWWRDR